MPRADRLVEMVHLLGGRRGRSMKEIVQHFEISERTVFRDLEDLQRRHIPVTRDESGYRLVEGAQLRPLNLTAEERAVLKLALGSPVLRRSPALARRVATLEAKLDAATAQAGETPAALTLATIDRSGPVPTAVVEALESAIQQRRAAEILYESLSGGTQRWRGVDPYRLFHRAHAWYLVGRCHVHDEPRIFRLDRVREARVTTTGFALPADFSLDAYLRDAWSVVRGDKVHEVVLRFDAALAPLIESARHHGSEVVQRSVDGEIEYRVRVSHLDEIARWVVGFGGRCRVVEPEALRRRVVQLAEEAVRAQVEQSPPAGNAGARPRHPRRKGPARLGSRRAR